MGFDLVPLSPLNSVQIPANANGGRSSFRANHTTSFFLVSGFGSGAYSAKLFAGTKQRFSGLSQARQCADDVFLILVHDATVRPYWSSVMGRQFTGPRPNKCIKIVGALLSAPVLQAILATTK